MPESFDVNNCVIIMAHVMQRSRNATLFTVCCNACWPVERIPCWYLDLLSCQCEPSLMLCA